MGCMKIDENKNTNCGMDTSSSMEAISAGRERSFQVAVKKVATHSGMQTPTVVSPNWGLFGAAHM